LLKRIKLENFKSFSDAEVSFGPLTVLIGTNASGKSNVKEALRFLNGVSRGYSLSEILNEKRATDGTLLWRGIRGGTAELIFKGLKEFQVTCDIELSVAGYTFNLQYLVRAVAFRPNLFRVTRESLYDKDRLIFDSHLPSDPPLQKDVNRLAVAIGNDNGVPTIASFENTSPILHQLSTDRTVNDHVSAVANQCIEFLSKFRFLDLDPNVLREPSFEHEIVLGEHGENLPSAVSHILHLEHLQGALADWLSELAAIEVLDFEFEPDLSGRLQLILVQADGWKVSATSASDGTLRFLGLLAALLTGSKENVFVIEELENGIHPSRVQLILQLMHQVSANQNVQILATSHSPQILQELTEETVDNAWLIFRPTQDKSSRARKVAEIIDIGKLKEAPDFAQLHTMGWFETVMNFMEES